MTNEFCKQLHDEYLAALKEWVSAADATKKYIAMKPLGFNDDITSLTEQQTNEMIDAYEREYELRKRCFEKMKAFLECRGLYKK